MTSRLGTLVRTAGKVRTGSSVRARVLRGIRYAACAAWLSVAALGGCQAEPGPFVRIAVSGLQPESTRLKIHIELNGMSKDVEFTGDQASLGQFSIGFGEGAAGDVKVTVESYDAQGCRISSGMASVAVAPSAVIDLPVVVQFDPSKTEACQTTYVPVTLRVFKQAQSGQTGQISADVPGVTCGSDCNEQTATYRRGTVITLTAKPDGAALFGGWTEDCAAAATNQSCSLTLTKDQTMVGAAFQTCTGWCSEAPATLATTNLNAIWGSGSFQIFAVGDSGKILTYAGQNWVPIAAGVTSQNLRGIGSAKNTPQDMFAGGDMGTILHLTTNGWKDVTGTSPSVKARTVYGFAGVGTGEVNLELAVAGLNGRGTDSTLGGLYYKLTGTETFEAFARDAMTSNVDIYAVANSTAGNEQFAVGMNGTIVRRYKVLTNVFTGAYTNTFEKATSGLPANTTVTLRGVWFGGPGSSPDSYAVGDSCTVLKRTGAFNAAWAPLTLPAAVCSGTTTLRGVWGSYSNNVLALYVVGDAGTLLKFDGTTWTKMDSRSSEQLNGVWGTSGTNVYVVGNRGTLLHYLP